MSGMRMIGLVVACVYFISVAGSSALGEGEATQDKMIRKTSVIAAPIASVWRAWTTTAGFREAIGAELEIELRPGGPFEIAWNPAAAKGERGSEGCRVLSFLPGRMLSFSWNAPPTFPKVRAAGAKTIVVVEMEAIGPTHTQVTLTHHGWPRSEDVAGVELRTEWEGTFTYFEFAWTSVLKAMTETLSKREGASAPSVKQGWTYLLKLTREVHPKDLTAEEQARIGEHAAYLASLTEAGTVVLAGPCTDMIGPGIVVFQAADEESARAVMENDPAVKAGVFTATLHPMSLSFLRGRD